ncbi:tRNA pseudouridine(13) synthase TruD [Aurantivibrio plasticivorans]
MVSTPYSLDFSFALGNPPSESAFKTFPEDFRVTENLSFVPEGCGEHIFVHVTKRNTNTEWLARQLAKAAGIEAKDVGYCGLKDRIAVTSQWFSLYHPKPLTTDLKSIFIEGVDINQVTRHRQKLRRGQHSDNHFCITLRNITYFDDVVTRLNQVKSGVPNYFGPQRFGIDAGNLVLAEKILVGRQKIKNRQSKYMAISAARSYLFNQILSKRIALGNWQKTLSGDPEQVPSGALWGRGKPLGAGETGYIEADVLGAYASWTEGLEHVGLQQERRPLISKPIDLSFEGDAEQLTISFSLLPGQFATTVLREVTDFSEN